LWVTVRPADLLTSSNWGRGKVDVGSALCAKQEDARKSTARKTNARKVNGRTVRTEKPMRFVYSNKMGVGGRRLAGWVFLVFGSALILAAGQRCAAQKPAESLAQLPIQPSFHFSDITAAAGIQFQHTV